MSHNNTSPNNDNQPTPEASAKYAYGGFNGQYKFNIKEILKRAYFLSAQNNWTLVLALITIIVLSFSVYFLFLDAFNITDYTLLITENSPLTQNQQAIIELTLTVLLAPLWTGVAMLAIATNRKTPHSALSIFSYYKMIPTLALASAIVSLFLTFGLALFFLPGFYIFTATTFTLPLIADKRIGPLTAVVFSVRMTNVYLWKMLQLYLIFLLLLFLVAVSFGFAYFWVGPLYFNAKAILYEDLFCAHAEQANGSQENQQQGVFDA